MIKVLLADDNKFFQKLYGNQLTKLGFEVVLVGDGEEALEKIRQQTPDIIVLDLIMPKIDGFDVLKTLQSDPQLNKIPVIVFSTLSHEDNIAQAKKLGAVDFIDKSSVGVTALHDKILQYVKV